MYSVAPSLSARPAKHPLPQDFIYVDVSNILVAAQHLALTLEGCVDSPETAAQQNLRHPRVRLNFHNLARLLAGSYSSAAARMLAVFSCQHGGDAICAQFQRAGFEAVAVARRNGKEKGVDSRIILEATKDLLSAEQAGVPAELTLASGDADFIPLLELARTLGFKSTVLAYRHGIATSVRHMADSVVEIDEWHQTLTFCVEEGGQLQ